MRARCPAQRFIPARAGNASTPRGAARRPAVHPRACGERVRAGREARLQPRFIPARAGNAQGGRMTTTKDRGSSPRVRGTRDVVQRGRVAVRFIPARAGNAGCRAFRGGRSTVHPRACGERPSAWRRSSSCNGSSPRVRGTHVGHEAGRVAQRFIPARAGNAVCSFSLATSESVHPRACGERFTPGYRVKIIDGSSPRVRGTHFFLLADFKGEFSAYSSHQRVAPLGTVLTSTQRLHSDC